MISLNMYRLGIVRYLDKQLLFQLCWKPEIIGNKRFLIKHQYPLLSIQNHFTNLLNNILVKQILWGQNSDIRQFLKDNVSGSRAAMSTFKEIFHVDCDAARDLLSKNPDFLLIPKKKIVDNYQLLKGAGVNVSLLHNNASLLTQDTERLQKKIDIVQKFTNDINEGIPFLYHSATILSAFARSNLIMTEENFKQNQLKYLVMQFGIRPRELYHIFAKYIYYIVQDSESTVEKLKLLLDYGVSVNSLINSNWPMYCSYKKMEMRLEQFSKSKLLPPPTPWIFTCNQVHFNSKVIEKALHVKSIDAQAELVDFLSKESGYSKTLIQHKMGKVRFKCPDINEAKRVAVILTEEGYTYHDIVWSVKILTLKRSSIEQRLIELKLQNYKAPFLNILLLSDKAFLKYVYSLHKCK